MDRIARREFLALSAGLPAMAARVGQTPESASIRPAGEFARRIRLSQDRLANGGFPAYTPEFVIADVKLDPAYPRLYSNFSGDVSGRYIEALSVSPIPGYSGLPALVRSILEYQRPDGRFGNSALSFQPDSIGKEQMALLWGNGRLLNGLVAYFNTAREPATLAAARRLGDFLLRVRQDASRPEVARRLEGLGAYGIICFTQTIEALVALAGATGDARYLDAARSMATLLPPRGVQHTHGYLTTLRGVLALYEATRQPSFLAFVEQRFNDLLESPDSVVYGGVIEFFGAETKGLSPEDLKKLGALDNKEPQDEGCALADLVRLGFRMWRVTGNVRYLEAGERCLMNQFFFNQFSTGDFGHHVLYARGFRPHFSPGKAWWCCTMHGYRAFADVLDTAVTFDSNAAQLNLFLDVECALPGASFDVANDWAADRTRIRFTRDSRPGFEMALRKPSWARASVAALNGKPEQPSENGGWLRIRRDWKKGDLLELRHDIAPRLERRDGTTLQLAQLGSEPVEAAFLHGPFLLGVHESRDPNFFERPWNWGGANENILRVPATRPGALAPAPAYRCRYRHGGWTGESTAGLYPISIETFDAAQQVLAVWLTFERG